MKIKAVSIDESVGAKSITLDIGDGYKLRGTRVTIGTFDLVVIDWEHPNHGYFTDAMLWIKSMHMKEWRAYTVARCFEEYKTLDDFLEEYPQLRELFGYGFHKEYSEEGIGSPQQIFRSVRSGYSIFAFSQKLDDAVIT